MGMDLKINTAQLASELALAKGCVDRKAVTLMAGRVKLEADAEHNLLVLTTTNLQRSFTSRMVCDVQQSGSLTVTHAALADYVGRLPDDEMRMSAKGAGEGGSPTDSTDPTDPLVHLSLRCGAAKARLLCSDADRFPQLPEPPETSEEHWSDLSIPHLAAALKRCLVSTAGEVSHYSLSAAQMQVHATDGDTDALALVSTDGHRLTVYEAGDPVTDSGQDLRDRARHTVLIERGAMVELGKLLADQVDDAIESGDMASFAVSDDGQTMFFRAGGRELVCRQMDGKFPDWQRVLPRDLHRHVTFDRDEMAAALKRVVQFADGRSTAVRFEIEAESDGESEGKRDGRQVQLVLSAETDGLGSSRESIPAAVVLQEGSPLEMSVHYSAQYVLDFLGVCPLPRATLSVGADAAKGAAMLRPANQPDEAGMHVEHRYVVMPIRA